MTPANVCRAAALFGVVWSVAAAGAGPADAQGGDKDQVIDGLLQIINHPDAANGSRLPETNRAIEALAALGRAAVPKLLDTIRGPNGTAAAYAGHALNRIPAHP